MSGDAVSVEMPDVNILLALFDTSHLHHRVAQEWLAEDRPWATCPLTENGFLRIASGTRYSGSPMSVVENGKRLREFVASHSDRHEFWPGEISLLDAALFDLSAVQGHGQLTDLYLLGLCQKRGGTLVTLDGRMHTVTRAIHSTRPDLIRLLQP